MIATPDADFCVRLLIATDEGLQSIVRLAIDLRNAEPATMLLVLAGTDAAFSFKPRPSTILIPGMPEGVIACVPQLDEFGVASRLASPLGLPGCYDGTVVELAELWLKSYEPARSPTTLQILVSGHEQTVRSVADLGRKLSLPVSVTPAQQRS